MRFQKMSLPIKIVSVCMVYVSMLDFVYCDNKYYTFERTEQLLLQSEFQTLQKTSAVGCCEYCRHTTGCETVSFKPSDGECRLSAIPPAAIFHDGSMSKVWNTYSLIDGKITTRVTLLHSLFSSHPLLKQSLLLNSLQIT